MLVIQTAFLGDAILATALIEKIHHSYPQAKLDFLIRAGYEGIFEDHPFLNKTYIFEKREGKLKNLISLLKQIRQEKYDCVINVHRYFSSGFLTAFSGSNQKVGFRKNPLSFLFNKKVAHSINTIDDGFHEIDRNQKLIEDITDPRPVKPKLYPPHDFILEELNGMPYVLVAPASVWFTKQLPEARWVDLINSIDRKYKVVLIGSRSEHALCERISSSVDGSRIINKAGELSLLQSAAVIKKAKMNYTNDSAPMHLASSVDAPVTAVFCSTVPQFGFGPLSYISHVVQSSKKPSCKPCGIHGKRKCPKGHFKCAEIEVKNFPRI